MITKRQRSVAMFLAVAVLVPAGVASAQVTTFTPGTTIRAADVNGNFTAVGAAVTAVAGRVTALEATAAAAQTLFSGQSGVDANADTDDVWVDVPGISIGVVLGAPGQIRYRLFARMYNFGATPGVNTSCSLRIVTDSLPTPLNGVFPETMGDWNAILTGGDTSPNNSQTVALGGQVPLAAGIYTLKVQVVRAATAGLTNSGNCQISRWPFSRATLFVDVLP